MGLRGAQSDFYVSGEMGGLTPIQPLKRGIESVREVCGMRGVAVKCIEITQNPDCEGSIPVHN